MKKTVRCGDIKIFFRHFERNHFINFMQNAKNVETALRSGKITVGMPFCVIFCVILKFDIRSCT